MARPISPDMSPKSLEKVRLGIDTKKNLSSRQSPAGDQFLIHMNFSYDYIYAWIYEKGT